MASDDIRPLAAELALLERLARAFHPIVGKKAFPNVTTHKDAGGCVWQLSTFVRLAPAEELDVRLMLQQQWQQQQQQPAVAGEAGSVATVRRSCLDGAGATPSL